MVSRRQFAGRVAGAAGWLAASVATRAWGQTRPFRVPEVFRTSAELVPTAVTVRDAAGRLVTTLDRGDFRIFEGGVEQPITQFTRERVPVSVALVLDVSDSMRGPRMEDAREAVRQFLIDRLAPDDEAAVVVFNHGSRVLSGWSRDRAPLVEALAAVRTTGGTAIYDAVNRALPLFAERAHPRAALVLVSDGADTASDTTVVDLKQQLGRGDVFLYGIAIDTPNARSVTGINPQVFRELSAQSGGYAEVVASTAEIAAATTRIADELNAQYMMGYTPVSPGDGRYRAIRVVTRQEGDQVRARRGVIR